MEFKNIVKISPEKRKGKKKNEELELAKFNKIEESDKKLVINPDKLAESSRKLGLVCKNIKEATNLIKDLEQELKKKAAGYYYRQGVVLLQVNLNRWYKKRYESFDSYVKANFGFNVSHAYNLMRIASVFSWDEIESIIDKPSVVELLSRGTIHKELRPRLLEHVKKHSDAGVGSKKLLEKINSIKTTFTPSDKRNIQKTAEKAIKESETKTKVVFKSRSTLVSRTEEKPRQVQFITESGQTVNSIPELVSAGTAGLIYGIDDEVSIQIVVVVEDNKIKTFVEFIENKPKVKSNG